MWALSYSGLGAMQAIYGLYWLRYPATKHRVLPLLLTLIVSGLGVAQLIKYFLPRDRPSNLRIAVPSEEFWSKSFPSGHTTTAFAIATMMILLTYKSRRWWHGPLAWIWAIGVGISRVYRGVHWPSDVLTGALAGIFSACALWLVMPSRWKGHED
ncbi:phosphatase PAP2 family protein [bacterium]|nr:MAG: phosphatase PAP2 family protein [bacterium]